MSESSERPRGLLTPSDRALLRGETEYANKQQYSNRYQKIRERITNGLLDFTLVQTLLRDRDRKRIFKDPATAAGVDEVPFHESIRAMLYWTYYGLKEQHYNFEALLSEAIEQAEHDFAREYQRDSVDVAVQFDVDVTQSHDIDELISRIEEGGPVKANQLYELLQLSSGVPIDTSKLDSIGVWFVSSYPEGEKAVLETLFADYLGVDVEVTDQIARVNLAEQGLEKENAVIDVPPEPLEPGHIKYGTDPLGSNDNESEETIQEIRSNRRLSKSPSEETDLGESSSPAIEAIDETLEDAEPPAPSIHERIEAQEETRAQEGSITPSQIMDLIEAIRDPFVSTIDVAKACGCAPEAAEQLLLTLREGGKLGQRSVMDTSGNNLDIWWAITK